MNARSDPRIRKLAATIAVCGIALFVDKLVIGPPSEAAAQSVEAAPAATPDAAIAATVPTVIAPSSRAGGDDPPPLDARRILAARLVAADEADEADGADEAVRPAGPASSEVDPASGLLQVFGDARRWWAEDDPDVLMDDDPEGLRATFERQARLTAVIHAVDGLGGAQINGRFVPLGGVIGGFRLISVGARSVILTGASGRVVLEMAVPSVGSDEMSGMPRPG